MRGSDCSAPARSCAAAAASRPDRRVFTGEAQVDFRFIDVDAADPDLDPIAKSEATSAPLADEPQATVAQVIVVIAKSGHMHEPVHVEIAQHDKNTEVRDAGDDALHDLANALTRECALVARFHMACSLVGAPLPFRAVLAEYLEGIVVIAK